MAKTETTEIAAEYVPVNGVSKISGLSVSLLNKLKASGNGPPYVKIRARILYSISALRKWMESQSVT